MSGEKLLALCAKALHDVPHENGCNTNLVSGLACTCGQRAERLTAGLAAMVNYVATQRERFRDRSTEAIHEALVATFREAAAAEVTIRITVKRSGTWPIFRAAKVAARRT